MNLPLLPLPFFLRSSAGVPQIVRTEGPGHVKTAASLNGDWFVGVERHCPLLDGTFLAGNLLWRMKVASVRY